MEQFDVLKMTDEEIMDTFTELTGSTEEELTKKVLDMSVNSSFESLGYKKPVDVTYTDSI